MIDITQEEIKRHQQSFSRELTAMYILMMEDMEKLINKAERENWTIEKLINEMEEKV